MRIHSISQGAGLMDAKWWAIIATTEDRPGVSGTLLEPAQAHDAPLIACFGESILVDSFMCLLLLSVGHLDREQRESLFDAYRRMQFKPTICQASIVIGACSNEEAIEVTDSVASFVMPHAPRLSRITHAGLELFSNVYELERELGRMNANIWMRKTFCVRRCDFGTHMYSEALHVAAPAGMPLSEFKNRIESIGDFDVATPTDRGYSWDPDSPENNRRSVILIPQFIWRLIEVLRGDAYDIAA